jgi:hypothetical protein
MRTLARAPRLRRNGSGSLEPVGDSAESVGDAGSVEIRVGPDAWTAGSPIIVFLRGGLDEEGPCPSDVGGGVTIGVDGVVPSIGGTKP